MRVPSDGQIVEAAVELGVIDSPDSPLPPRLRAKVAKALQVAEESEKRAASQKAARVDSAAFAADCVKVWAALLDAGLPEQVAERVLPAVAGQVWTRRVR